MMQKDLQHWQSWQNLNWHNTRKAAVCTANVRVNKMEEELEKAFLLFFLFIPGRSLRHIAPWHHVMYRKKELAVCSASSF